MDWQISPYLPALAISGVVALITCALAWRWRSAQGAVEIAALALLSGLWSWLYALELSSAEFAVALTWAKIEYICIAGVPTMLLVFAARYTGRDGWLAGRRWLFLAAFPALTLLAVWSNDLHRLYWSEMRWVASGSVSILKFSYGPLFWAFITYSYVCVTGATWLLLQSILRAPQAYRGSTAALLVAIVAIWGGNALYLSGLSPWGYLDLTPVSSTISGLAITLGIYRLRLFDLLPIAYSMVFGQLSDGVVVIDVQNRVADLNPAAQRDLGSVRGSIIGVPAREVFSRWPHLIDRYQQIKPLSDELEVAMPEGASRWLDLRISPLYNRRGNLRGRVIVWHDITERKAAEADLRAARDAAEMASRAKSAFLANMSHELRTPLSAIMGYCQLMRLEVEQGEVEQALLDLDMIEHAGEHLLRMIANLLQLAQIEAQDSRIRLAPIALGELLAELADSMRATAARKGNALLVRVDDPATVFQADRARLRQVLLNLLDNAAKFTEGGTITLEGRCVGGEAGAYAIFSVIDTGVGIAPDELGKIFEIFAEPDIAKRRKFGGAGVGLAICRRFCIDMGGDIEATSALGCGTTMTVRLPMGGPADLAARPAEGELA
ncbi:PAS domain-containing protein [Oscillochloris sp. ZM17-4]|uniref:sensor histidine kinase n=1 Tax=Oscillochloris sp. ZM17-4 TaxID=2866714 RepID=UPI001C7341DD|nr:histidine kinase N-terminal 7TM domain-containing protein [Oscillochloris sp. ZM17-4]MBX0327840.1 PAS domain-containing protein [Oscillochloris sp. ZM17-4]